MNIKRFRQETVRVLISLLVGAIVSIVLGIVYDHDDVQSKLTNELKVNKSNQVIQDSSQNSTQKISQVDTARIKHEWYDIAWIKTQTYVFGKKGIFGWFIHSLLVWIILTVYYRVNTYTKCPYFFKAPEQAELVISLEGILNEIKGLYQEVLDAHRPLQDAPLRRMVQVFINEVQQNFTPALVFLNNDCSLNRYAQIAKCLDREAIHSIKSINISRPSELVKDNDIKEHFEIVKEKSKNLTEGVFRIQLLRNDGDISAPQSIVSVDEYTADLNDIKTKKWWESTFENSPKLIHKIVNWNTHGVEFSTFYGDFIMYDQKAILSYDYETHLLCLIIGEKVIKRFHKLISNVLEP